MIIIAPLVKEERNGELYLEVGRNHGKKKQLDTIFYDRSFLPIKIT